MIFWITSVFIQYCIYCLLLFSYNFHIKVSKHVFTIIFLFESSGHAEKFTGTEFIPKPDLRIYINLTVLLFKYKMYM